MKYDTVVIGGGASGCAAAGALAAEGQRVCLVTAGLTLRSLEMDKPYSMLAGAAAAGVAVMRGVKVTGGIWAGDTLYGVQTDNDVTLRAADFVLATGRFFSCGLVATREKIFEPIFDADIDAPAERAGWFCPDFFERQPFECVGVKTEGGRVQIRGNTAENLFAAGSISVFPISGEEVAKLILEKHAGE